MELTWARRVGEELVRTRVPHLVRLTSLIVRGYVDGMGPPQLMYEDVDGDVMPVFRGQRGVYQYSLAEYHFILSPHGGGFSLWGAYGVLAGVHTLCVCVLCGMARPLPPLTIPPPPVSPPPPYSFCVSMPGAGGGDEGDHEPSDSSPRGQGSRMDEVD